MSAWAALWQQLARVLALSLVAAAAVLPQRQVAAGMRSEITWRREDRPRLEQLRAENRRLKAAAISVEELQRLRSDRAALLQLRAEIEALQARVGEKPPR